ncbi:MAG: chromate transporter [Clostridia bacterium]|nr:chromate transporter [Clostridia bacterium]
MIFLKLFFSFFKTGLFAIGGGMATIPFLYEMADTTGWFTRDDLANMIAVSESTPGPIGVNMATYVGFITGSKVAGIPTAIIGAVTATLGLITPAVIIILVVASFLKNFRDNKQLNNAFYGLRPASTGLIAAAGISVAVTVLFPEAFSLAAFNFKGAVLAVILLALTNVKQLKKLHPIVFIAASAAAGVIFKM